MASEQEVKTELELFKAESFLPNLQPSTEVQEFLEKSSDLKYLRDMTGLDLQERAFQLARYAAFLTTQENRLRSYIGFCESNLKNIVGQKLPDSWGFSFQEKDLYIRTHDDNAKEYQEKKDLAQAKLDYIHFLSNKFQAIVDVIKNLCYEKSRVARL